MTTTTYTVNTEHYTADGIVLRTTSFADFDDAFAYAEANNPDTDGSMMPNVSEALVEHPRYERGMFWFGNRYAVITSG